VLRTLSPMINAALITPLLGRMDYARLQAMRVAYHADYGRELRDDLKSKIFPTASYGKLMRHVTMSRAEWALKVFKTARALDKKSTATSTRLAAELQAVEALCVCDRKAMKELEAAMKAARDCKTLVEELGTNWLSRTPGGDKVRNLLLGMVKNRLGIGGMPSTSPKEATPQGEALAELLKRDDPVGLEALCRQLCSNRTREHLDLVRAAFEAKMGAEWLDANLLPRVLKGMRGEPLLHAALSLCFNDTQYYFVNYLFNTCGGNTSGSRSHGKLRSTGSLKATWQLEGKQCTEAMSHLVTLCKDRQLATVGQLLPLAPFSMSLGTLVLSVPDSETRKLLSLVVDTACRPSTTAAAAAASATAPPPEPGLVAMVSSSPVSARE